MSTAAFLPGCPKADAPGHPGVFPGSGVLAADVGLDVVDPADPSVGGGESDEPGAGWGGAAGGGVDPDPVAGDPPPVPDDADPFQDVCAAQLPPGPVVVVGQLVVVVEAPAAAPALPAAEVLHAGFDPDAIDPVLPGRADRRCEDQGAETFQVFDRRRGPLQGGADAFPQFRPGDPAHPALTGAGQPDSAALCILGDHRPLSERQGAEAEKEPLLRAVSLQVDEDRRQGLLPVEEEGPGWEVVSRPFPPVLPGAFSPVPGFRGSPPHPPRSF